MFMTIGMGSSGAEFNRFNAGLWTVLPRKDGLIAAQFGRGKQSRLICPVQALEAAVSSRKVAVRETKGRFPGDLRYGTIAIF
jgi:hypothetical protein